MNQIPDLCDETTYSGEIVFKICCVAPRGKLPIDQTLNGEDGSMPGTGIMAGEAFTAVTNPAWR
jgi:hypothetical protein